MNGYTKLPNDPSAKTVAFWSKKTKRSNPTMLPQLVRLWRNLTFDVFAIASSQFVPFKEAVRKVSIVFEVYCFYTSLLGEWSPTLCSVFRRVVTSYSYSYSYFRNIQINRIFSVGGGPQVCPNNWREGRKMWSKFDKRVTHIIIATPFLLFSSSSYSFQTITNFKSIY